MSEIEYISQWKDEWNETASKTFTVTVEPLDLALSGPCPNCKHEMTHYEPMKIILGFMPIVAKQKQPLNEKIFTVLCNCTVKHPGSDENHGCGAYWKMRVILEG